MDKWGVYMEINQLLKQGFSKSKTAEKLGISRSTLYRYIKRQPKDMGEWTESLLTRQKKLDPNKTLILNWLRKHPDMSASQVSDWLVEKYPSLNVGESTVRSYVRALRKDYDIPKETTKRSYEAVPEGPMGHQVQIDFGQAYYEKARGGHIKLYFIAFVLSHSRYKYMYWLDRHFTTKDVIYAHELAFKWFEGVPDELVYDQDNLIVVSENGGDLILTEEFQSYKETMKLNLHVCRKADPESKGKIENVVGFIKKNFGKHRVFQSLDKWNEQAIDWLNRTGNARLHNTIKKRPADVFSLEKEHLRPIPNKEIVPYNVNTSIARSIRKDNTIRYLSNRYSLPLGSFHKYDEVFLTLTDEQMLIICCPDGEILAKHKLSIEKGKLVQDRTHTRDRTKGIDAFLESVSRCFKNEALAGTYLSQLRENYPRYIRDQLQMVSKVAKATDKDILEQALEECVKRKLFSATDISDVVDYIKRQRLIPDTTMNQEDGNLPSSSKRHHWVMTTGSQKRDMNQYYSILEGELS
ncbi:IS21 family transposase [Pontibacillus yanchengensis]|uniref:IS21 family transposase n=1 Tax=Pontibacillus yanchengensis TaxID=462910 RepID=A0A6I5A6Y2_9BACI|nr:IS21 family transposase [Pontibacillus yanchengensis]